MEYLREHHLLLKKSIKRKKGGLRTQDEFEFIHEHELLSPGGIIMAECLKEDELHDSVGDIVVCKREVYGITAITIYRRES